MPKDTRPVEVTPASLRERGAIENLFQLYTHDFSENWAGTDLGDVDVEGRFAPYPLDRYWTDSSHTPLLLRIGSQIVGFALLNNESHVLAPVDMNIAEFFVLRKYRRNGVGTAAAHAVFARYSGIWEAAVARKNVFALAFWRRTIGGFPNVMDLTEDDVQTDHWDGPVLRFRVPN
ncbi:GNAT family N-acetyltransferase [Mesorhizobium sp. M0954]|uniref:GNAT family N-acetyltransferase n=1 Tax=Mesorhizobium sp. M0954 TaxID=2957032 RepID=UPI00333965B6